MADDITRTDCGRGLRRAMSAERPGDMADGRVTKRPTPSCAPGRRRRRRPSWPGRQYRRASPRSTSGDNPAWKLRRKIREGRKGRKNGVSYYTKHEASWDGTEVTEEEVSRTLAEIAADDGSVRTPESRSGQDPASRWLEIITGEQRAEWAQVDTHMRELSTRYPGVRFTVNGQGEDQGDTWREHFQGGRSQMVHMDGQPFDPEKLE